MKKILVKYEGFEENNFLSQGLKFISYHYPDITFYVEGLSKDIAIFSGFSDQIKTIETDNISSAFNLDEYDAIVSKESINQEFSDSFNIFKSFRKRFALYVNKENNFDVFYKINEKLNHSFYLIDNDYFLDKGKLVLNSNFKDIKKVEDIFYDDADLFVVSKQYYELFNSFLLAISNYFLKRYLEKTTKTGFAKIAQNLFKWQGGNDDIGTLFEDLTYYFSLNYQEDKFFLTIKENYKTNDIIKGLNVLCSFVEDKFDLINK